MDNSKIGNEKIKERFKFAFQEPIISRNLNRKEPKDWKDLQAKVAKLYGNLGCKTEVEVFVEGVRTKHKIDVFVIFEFGGLKYRIIIECKYWNTKVRKAQVGTLVGVLEDIGAEKGIIVSKKGFQPGAHKLASYTNIDLLTFRELIKKSELHLERFKIHYILDKIRTLSIPFHRFEWRMKEEAEKRDLFWYPNERGSRFIGALYMLRSHVEYIDLKTFPRAYVYSFISNKEEISKVIRTRKEYLDFILDNLALLEKEYETYKEEIFSE